MTANISDCFATKHDNGSSRRQHVKDAASDSQQQVSSISRKTYVSKQSYSQLCRVFAVTADCTVLYGDRVLSSVWSPYSGIVGKRVFGLSVSVCKPCFVSKSRSESIHVEWVDCRADIFHPVVTDRVESLVCAVFRSCIFVSLSFSLLSFSLILNMQTVLIRNFT